MTTSSSETSGSWRMTTHDRADAEPVPGVPRVRTREFDTFAKAQHAGLHAACWNITTRVEVHAPDGTLECEWDRSDNLWRTVGPVAQAQHAAEAAKIHAEMIEVGKRNRAEALHRLQQPS